MSRRNWRIVLLAAAFAPLALLLVAVLALLILGWNWARGPLQDLVRARGTGGGALGWRDQTPPYPLQFELQSAGTTVQAQDRITGLYPLAKVDLQVELAGPTQPLRGRAHGQLIKLQLNKLQLGQLLPGGSAAKARVGRIDLGSETLDLQLQPRTKVSSVVALRGPIRLRGPLSDPQLSLAAGGAEDRYRSRASRSPLNCQRASGGKKLR